MGFQVSAQDIYLYCGKHIDTKLGQGRDSVKEVIKDNPDLMDEPEGKIKEAIKVLNA